MARARGGRAELIDAVADFQTSSDHYERAGDVLGAALADNNLAEVLTLQFHLDAAEELLTRARRVTQAANYPHGHVADRERALSNRRVARADSLRLSTCRQRR